MDANSKKVEAVLFAVGKDITSERLASLCSLSIKEVDAIVNRLVKENEQQDNSLKIIKKAHA